MSMSQQAVVERISYKRQIYRISSPKKHPLGPKGALVPENFADFQLHDVTAPLFLKSEALFIKSNIGAIQGQHQQDDNMYARFHHMFGKFLTLLFPLPAPDSHQDKRVLLQAQIPALVSNRLWSLQ